MFIWILKKCDDDYDNIIDIALCVLLIIIY